MLTEEKINEAMTLAKWWLSRSNYRLHLMYSAGGMDVCLQDLFVYMLTYPPRTQMKFSTWVINCLIWSLCRTLRKQANQVPTEEWTDQPDRDNLFHLAECREMGTVLWALAMKHLDPRHAGCLVRWCHGETLQEIGDAFGISRERARQLIAKALRRIRRPDLSERIYRLSGVTWKAEAIDDGDVTDSDTEDEDRNSMGRAAAAREAVCA